MDDTKINADSYLKTGSNELRILEYRAAGISFGINILKVSKIVSHITQLIQVPESHPSIQGVFKDMNRLVPIIDLATVLGEYKEKGKHDKVIVTEFFGLLTGFHVDRIDWIHHFKWEDVIDAKHVFSGIDQKYVLGIVKPTEDHMVLLLDYETILLDIRPEFKENAKVTCTDNINDMSHKKILVAEDSPAVRAMLVNELQTFGCDVVEATDGLEGWEAYKKESFDLVISDVEMPQMDGLALTMRIRQSERPDTPVIVYSSIGDMGMKARAKYLKADAHITKLNLNKLIISAGKLMNGEKIDFDSADNDIETNSSETATTITLD